MPRGGASWPSRKGSNVRGSGFSQYVMEGVVARLLHHLHLESMPTHVCMDMDYSTLDVCVHV